MRDFDTPLPIDEALPRLTAALAAHNAAVLVAPPGAGKTTRVPLVLLDEPWAAHKKILVLEPRRLAARAAAARMASTLQEQAGDTVGLRVRFGSKISRRTRIEVVTEGVFTRLVLDDPSLDGVAAVLFDEFHERSLDADLGLALARDVQQGLRDDLKILVMSATLDGARVSALLGEAPVVESQGRSFPVETRYLGREARARIEDQVAGAIERALRAETGSALVFLPGAGEIRRTETLLKERVRDPAVDVVALYGALDAREQDRAIAPAPPGRRKVVLATSIAETSLTIEGVRVVIDSGLSRVPRYEPDVGLTRLETVRVSRAAADQRRGRAGRIEPGVCYRLWDEPQTGSLEPYTRPEILSADLSSFVLDLAQWGASDPGKLAFLDPPPQAALREAKALLSELTAIDPQGRITEEGRRLRALPLPPRLARMVVDAAAEGAGQLAAEIAAVLSERGLGGDDPDLRHRLDQFRRDRSARAQDARAMAKRWASVVESSPRAQRAPSPVYGGGAGRGAPPPPRSAGPPPPPPGGGGGARRGGGRPRAALGGGGGRGPPPLPPRFARRPPPQAGEEKEVSSRLPIPIASPRTAVAGRAPSCSPTVAAAMSMPRRPWRANRSWRWPNSQVRRRRAASCWRRRLRLRRSRRASPPRSKTARRSRSTQPQPLCARAARAGSAPSCLPSMSSRSRPTPTAPNCWRKASPRSASANCRGARRRFNCATACCSCGGPPISSLPEIGNLLSPSRLKPTWAVRNGRTCPTPRSRVAPPIGWRRP